MLEFGENSVYALKALVGLVTLTNNVPVTTTGESKAAAEIPTFHLAIRQTSNQS